MAYLLSRECKNAQKLISDDLAIFSMISDERTINFCHGIVVTHHEMPEVGVVNCLRMRIVHSLVKFPPHLIALYPPLHTASISYTSPPSIIYGAILAQHFCLIPRPQMCIALLIPCGKYR